MRFLFIYLMILGFSFSSSKFAHANIIDTYYINYHFTSVAFGKPVKSVMVHTGILANEVSNRDPMKALMWVDIHDLFMTKVGDHFFVKTVMKWSFNTPNSQGYGPIVEYWVQFEDGSSTILQKSLIPIAKSEVFEKDVVNAEKANEEASRRFSISSDSLATTAEKISYWTQDN